MLRKVTWLAVFASVLLVAPLSAQDKRVEISFLAGWTFSDGVDSGGEVWVNPNLDAYDRLDPKDSFKWGLTGGFLVTENAEVGFQYGQQASTLVAGGVGATPNRDLGDLKVSTYHGYFAYNFFEEDAPVRPFVLFGMGATNFGSVAFQGVGGVNFETNSFTQFSTTWAAGAKFFFHPNVGARAQVQWTPTYIKSDYAGYWCDPWWGCYAVGDAQYASQWDLSGGVIFRF
jgi:hypothetical protein